MIAAIRTWQGRRRRMTGYLPLLGLWVGLLLIPTAVNGQTRPVDPPPVDGPGQPISASVSLVTLNVVVNDSYGFPVSGLKGEDFEVYDNGRLQEVTHFQETSEPISVVMLVDSSGSTHKNMPLIKRGAVEFIRRLRDARPTDRLAVVNFNDDVTLLAPFESSWAMKIALIQDRVESVGGTALYDTLFLVSRDLLRAPGRKLVILYTDGVDNKSLTSFQTAYRMALDTDATFFVLTVDTRTQALADPVRSFYTLARQHYYAHLQGEGAARAGAVEPMWTDDMRRQVPTAVVIDTTYRLAFQWLERLARTTGGRFFKVDGYDALPGIYRQIVQEIPFHYTIGFRPPVIPGDRSYHQLEVRMRKPGLEPRYRRGYYAARPE